MTRKEKEIIFNRLAVVERKYRETKHKSYRAKAAVLTLLINELGLVGEHCKYLGRKAAA